MFSTSRLQAELGVGSTPAAGLAQAAAEGGVDPDPVLEHLLLKARSPEVREQFLLIPPENFTAQHQVKVLVSPAASSASSFSP
jgi:hypothetical protein